MLNFLTLKLKHKRKHDILHILKYDRMEWNGTEQNGNRRKVNILRDTAQIHNNNKKNEWQNYDEYPSLNIETQS